MEKLSTNHVNDAYRKYFTSVENVYHYVKDEYRKDFSFVKSVYTPSERRLP